MDCILVKNYILWFYLDGNQQIDRDFDSNLIILWRSSLEQLNARLKYLAL